MKEVYNEIVESFSSGKVVPRHIELLDQDEGKPDSAVEYNEVEVAEMMALVNRIVQSCSFDPEKVLFFLFCFFLLIKEEKKTQTNKQKKYMIHYNTYTN